MIEAEPAAGPSEAGHHLVGDEQDAVAAADLGDQRPVAVGRDHGRQRRANDRLGDERGDGAGPAASIVRSSSAASSSASPRAWLSGSPAR